MIVRTGGGPSRVGNTCHRSVASAPLRRVPLAAPSRPCRPEHLLGPPESRHILLGYPASTNRCSAPERHATTTPGPPAHDPVPNGVFPRVERGRVRGESGEIMLPIGARIESTGGETRWRNQRNRRSRSTSASFPSSGNASKRPAAGTPRTANQLLVEKHWTFGNRSVARRRCGSPGLAVRRPGPRTRPHRCRARERGRGNPRLHLHHRARRG